MQDFLEDYVDRHPYDSEEGCWDDYLCELSDALTERYGERNISEISVGEYSDDDSLADIADCMLRFAKYHKVLDYCAFYSDKTDTTWVLIKYAKTLE